MKLNLGCGYDKKKGFVNIDKSAYVNPDIVLDIENGLPFLSDSIEYIFSNNCLEHIKPNNWAFVLDEIMRVACDGCILELILPYDNTNKRCNIDHYRTFNFNSFNQFLIKEKYRAYYSDWKLERLHYQPSKFVIKFYSWFPMLKNNIYFKFKIHKEAKE